MPIHHDIIICGAGPVGQALALLLVRRGIDPAAIALIDAKPAEQALQDRRTIALSYGSSQILDTARAWPVSATPIHQIHVSRKGHFGRTLIDRTTQQVPALGYVARYADILAPLSRALARDCPALTFYRPARAVQIVECDDYAAVTLEDQRVLHGSIVVQAEGGLFAEQTSQARHHDYQQTALIGTVQVSAPIASRAYERFTDQGPLALLPKHDGYGLVWCVTPARAAELMTLDDRAFLQQLQQGFGDRLGTFTDCSSRVQYALGLNAQAEAPQGRTIRIGNAAQTLHPVAGQGLNLGLRDAVQLAESLSAGLTPAALQDFYANRQPDRNQVIGLTDRMARVFTETRTPQSLLGAGLGLIDLVTPAQQWLANQMMFGSR